MSKILTKNFYWNFTYYCWKEDNVRQQDNGIIEEFNMEKETTRKIIILIGSSCDATKLIFDETKANIIQSTYL